ncbi:hypothetical protein K402DRAFT_239927 [Aulographum hederae CBS 113979]|uniref:Uncharacterized protein n=1 Tax=Aulographum hederae CBS 113979 TaxID=1176131 RepID=A0A6G1GKH5_9PEZI|nr:hypothetical protein K402DRAFT_239927 [Aulographum hederae CBS 113979]
MKSSPAAYLTLFTEYSPIPPHHSYFLYSPSRSFSAFDHAYGPSGRQDEHAVRGIFHPFQTTKFIVILHRIHGLCHHLLLPIGHHPQHRCRLAQPFHRSRLHLQNPQSAASLLPSRPVLEISLLSGNPIPAVSQHPTRPLIARSLHTARSATKATEITAGDATNGSLRLDENASVSLDYRTISAAAQPLRIRWL